jgi:HTH-type transcriptional regulator/antitoxin HigA
MNMVLKSIKNKKEYHLALKRLELIFNAKPGTDEGAELEVLGTLVGKYEEMHFPIDIPDPIEAIKYRMEQMGLSQNDSQHL